MPEPVIKLRVAILFLVMGFLAMGCGGDKSKDEGGAKLAKQDFNSYRYLVEVENKGSGRMRLEYLADKTRSRMKLSTRENGKWQTASFIINDGKNTYMVNAEAKMAMKMPGSQGGMMGAMPPGMLFVPEWNTYLEKHGNYKVKELGREKVNGVKVTVFEVSQPGQGTSTMYVDDDSLIRRIKVADENGEDLSVMDVKEVELDPSISDSDFQPPKGYTIQSMPGMPSR